MGNKGSKKKPSAAGETKPIVLPPKNGLNDKDFAFLTSQTDLSKADIQNIYEQFKANNPDERLDRAEFIRLYDKLRPESQEAMDEISQFVFGAFDEDNNGYISFNEFLVI
jgi:Ca2+-binding EF-hand superfamily protein